MKLFTIVLLALLAVDNVLGNSDIQDALAALEAAWNMSEPEIEYMAEDDHFKIKFNTTGTDYFSNTHINEEFYDVNCKAGNGTDHVVASGVTSVSPGPNGFYSRPTTTRNAAGEFELNFKLQTDVLVQDPKLYTHFSTNGTGRLQMCIRTSIGYGGIGDIADESVGSSLTLQEQIDSGYQEINYIESIVTINYNLTGDFDVSDVTLLMTEQTVATAYEEQYGVKAWLCNMSAPESEYGVYTPPADEQIATRQKKYPPGLNNPGFFFQQGALISVCIRPDDEAYEDAVMMQQITNFTWERLNTATPVLQPAVINGQPASNSLTYYPDCDGKDFCSLSSILFADFYASGGSATGFGSAKTRFEDHGSSRQLRDSSRLLQTASEKSLAIEILLEGSYGDRPYLLRTSSAGKTSLGFTVCVVSLMTLVSSFFLLAP